ncbi:MAG: serine/threonine-protein kinase [Nannocystaceae bacterium]|nr:serine/threonine-protein kinase [Nannocystaceae bacterium]
MAGESTTASATAGPPDGGRWRAIGRARQDPLQLELARRKARMRLFEEPPAAVTVGRYLVLGRIGSGGMGVVYAAFDPQLDRKIALKVLYADGSSDDRHRRLLREAQALAQLTHPNVVAIHDVGSFDPPGGAGGGAASVFLAMEYVEGETLTRWLAQPRRWQEILDTMVEAARGIAAAHAKGLVHRDFKPDNVMVGADGRVRVMDFGLARAAATPATDRAAAPASTLALELTTASTIVGTPAYMAPEQHAGAPADALSDQFAFCVATWEAICGERPFAGDSLPELATAVSQGRLREWPRSARTPPWLRRALERGLARQPQARWPTMNALVAALERVRGRVRRRRTALVVGACVGVALAAAAGRELLRLRDGRQCDAAAAHGSAWDPATRGNVRDAIVATGLDDAADTAARVLPRLDAVAREWTEASATACRALRVEARWSPDTHARSQWCLEQRRLELAALTDALQHADAATVRTAAWAVAALQPAAACIDAQRLARLPAPPSDPDGLVHAVRVPIAAAWAQTALGHPREGLAQAERALQQALALSTPSLVAAAHLAVGLAREQLGDGPAAVVALRDAYFIGGGANELELAERSATAAARVLDATAGAGHDARTWLRVAEVEDARMGDGEGIGDAERLLTRGTVLAHAGELEAARADLEQAVAIGQQRWGEQHPAFGRALQRLAGTELALGHREVARALLQRADAVFEAALGPEHPDRAAVLSELATTSK